MYRRPPGSTRTATRLPFTALFRSRQRRPRNMRVPVDGALAPHGHAKDLALHLLGMIGVDGAGGHVIEYAGDAVRALSMEARMTLCNLSIEMGARADRKSTRLNSSH